jgi:hypothetical protein
MVTANAAGITGAEIAKVNMSNAQKEIEALRAVDMTRTSLLSLFHTAHSNWLKLKDKHSTTQANCNKTFYSTFGVNIIASVQDLLHSNRYRAAWKFIVDKYAVNIGGQNNASAIMKELTNLRYDSNIGMTRHINKLVMLLHQMETFGEPAVSNNMKMAYLVSSIKNSDNYQYTSIINMHEMMNWSYNELLQQLYKRESMLLVNSNSKEKKEKYNESSNHVKNNNDNKNKNKNKNNNNNDNKNNNENNNNNDNNNNNKCNNASDSNNVVIKCDFCHKIGHDKSICFMCNPCTICGKLGHSTARCYHNKDNHQQNKTNNSNNTNNMLPTVAITPRQFSTNT